MMWQVAYMSTKQGCFSPKALKNIINVSQKIALTTLDSPIIRK